MNDFDKLLITYTLLWYVAALSHIKMVIYFASQYCMVCDDSRFAFVRRAPYCKIANAYVNNTRCENRLNLIMWLYWDSEIPGIPLKYLQLLPGEVFICKTDDGKKIEIDLITKKYCNGDDIIFNEVLFAK